MIFNGSQLAKIKFKKSIFLAYHHHEIYRVEAVGLKSSNYTFKKIQFLWKKKVKFGAISRKIDILSIAAYLKFESKNPFV